MNALLLVGLAIAVGLGGGKGFQRLKIPQVVGYIIMGTLLGTSFLGILSLEVVESLSPMSNFALGLIGFMIGGELKLSVFKKFGRTIFTILFVEVFGTFFLVVPAMWLITDNLPAALVFGALATATAPAATVDVLWEYKSKGPLTTTLLAIVGLDDALALIVYGFATAYAKAMITHAAINLNSMLITPLTEIGGSIALGCACGMLLGMASKKMRSEGEHLTLIIASVLLCGGIANQFHLSQIMACMFLGMTIANLEFVRSEQVFRIIERITPPIYILFFVLIGAKLQIKLLPAMGLVGIVYIAARSVGKLVGANLGGRISNAEESVRKYLGFSLFSQAGVAIGLSLAVAQEFSRFGAAGQELSALVINVITATTFVVQMIGPPCVKYAITKAGEVGKGR